MRGKKAFLVLFSVMLIFLSAACAREEAVPTVEELLNLGEQYLLDLDYEQALVQFFRVIEMEPRTPRGYLGAAEAYLEMGMDEDAAAILKQGLEATGDPAIQSMLDGLTAQPPPLPEEAEPEWANLTGEALFSLADLEEWGFPPGLTIWDVQGALALEAEDIVDAVEARRENVANGETGLYRGVISSQSDFVVAYPVENEMLVGISISGNNGVVTTAPRGIPLGATMEEVMSRFAVSNQAALDFARTLDPGMLDEGVLFLYEQIVEEYILSEGRPDDFWGYVGAGRNGAGDISGYSITYEFGDTSHNESYTNLEFWFDVNGILESYSVWYYHY